MKLKIITLSSHLIMHDVLNVGNVQPPGCHVCGNEKALRVRREPSAITTVTQQHANGLR
jgi:hypothetical protein